MCKKVALITGGSRGIGAACALKLSQNGYKVAINYFKNHELAEELALKINTNGGEAVAFYGDVRELTDCENLVKQTADTFGGLDLVVANAGISGEGLVQDMSIEEYMDIVATNLNGSFYIAKAAVPRFISQKSGNIIFMSSILGQVGGSCEAAYSATKAGQIGLMKSLAKELGLSGVRVNAVAPGLIETDMTKVFSKEVIDEVVASTTLNRVGVGSDVASAVLFLASDEASFITGEVLQVSGGLLI